MDSKVFFSFIVPRKDPVEFESIPEELYPDFNTFMFGRTITKINGKFMSNPSDFNEWVNKVYTHGLDYNIELT